MCAFLDVCLSVEQKLNTNLFCGLKCPHTPFKGSVHYVTESPLVVESCSNESVFSAKGLLNSQHLFGLSESLHTDGESFLVKKTSYSYFNTDYLH